MPRRRGRRRSGRLSLRPSAGVGNSAVRGTNFNHTDIFFGLVVYIYIYIFGIQDNADATVIASAYFFRGTDGHYRRNADGSRAGSATQTNKQTNYNLLLLLLLMTVAKRMTKRVTNGVLQNCLK